MRHKQSKQRDGKQRKTMAACALDELRIGFGLRLLVQPLTGLTVVVVLGAVTFVRISWVVG